MKKDSPHKLFLPFGVLALFTVAVAWFFHVFVEAYTDVTYLLSSVLIVLLMFLMSFCVLSNKGETKKKAALKSLVATFAGAVGFFGLTFYFDNINDLGSKKSSSIGIAAAATVIFVPFIINISTMRKTGRKTKAISAIISLICVFAMGLSYLQIVAFPELREIKVKNYNTQVASPVCYGHADSFTYKGIKMADFYVSPDGNDENDGSLEKPFKTIQKARDTIRAIDKSEKTEIIVGIMPGDYRISGLTFTSEDSGTEACPVRYCKYGEGEVVLNGGVSLKPEDFSEVTDESVLSRLSEEAKKNVRCINLSEYDITKEDYGKIYTIGSHNCADKYDGDYVGAMYSEVFFNDKRMTLARYPDINNDFLYTEEVVSTGDGLETDGSPSRDPDWETRRNYPGDVYRVNESLANRINSWKTFDDIWMFGWWKYDWADASSPFGEFNAEERTLSPKFVSIFGTKVGAPYYFFNVFEELTAPGEFYIDRENGILYIYPTEDMATAKIDMSLITTGIFTVDNASHISFEGLTFKGTRGDAITINGNSNRVTHCLIKNTASNAIVANGYDNICDYNEITRTGRGGIVIGGGDRETLTAGNNKAENNLIHHWSEIYQAYQPAVTLNGVGNICAHNEMYNSPHEAITWNGNNHIMEYNVIHDVCLLTNDGAAIYSGRRWDYYGNVIRYNLIYNVGSTVKNGDEEIRYTPDGIYLDDALSGQKVYGNILVNIPKYSVHLGGGRDNEVRNNIIINPMHTAIHFDDRAREGAINNGWFNHSSDKNGGMWKLLFESPWKSKVWQKAFPQMTRFSDDFNDTDNPDFVPNPSYCDVSGNAIISIYKDYTDAPESAYRFSKIENNPVYKLSKINDIFVDPANGDYTVKDNSPLLSDLPQFEAVSLSGIGITTEEK